MELHELFDMTGDVWFRKGDYHYNLEQVQTIMREVLRAQPENAQVIFSKFELCDKTQRKDENDKHLVQD